jgi:hypothetical protein
MAMILLVLVVVSMMVPIGMGLFMSLPELKRRKPLGRSRGRNVPSQLGPAPVKVGDDPSGQ